MFILGSVEQCCATRNTNMQNTQNQLWNSSSVDKHFWQEWREKLWTLFKTDENVWKYTYNFCFFVFSLEWSFSYYVITYYTKHVTRLWFSYTMCWLLPYELLFHWNYYITAGITPWVDEGPEWYIDVFFLVFLWTCINTNIVEVTKRIDKQVFSFSTDNTINQITRRR